MLAVAATGGNTIKPGSGMGLAMTSHQLPSGKLSLALFLGAIVSIASPGPAKAAVYGCSIAGQWQCYPSPQRCYKNASYLSVIKFPNYAACQSRRK